jgi:hypothetical protein
LARTLIAPCRFLHLCAGAIVQHFCGYRSARQHLRSYSLQKTTTSKARRLQRQRRSDRALVTLACANRRLERHHGSAHAMPPPKHWLCHGKDAKGQPCGYMVPKGKAMCYACGHEPPEHISGAGSGKPKPPKGEGKDGKASDSEQAADWLCKTCTNRSGAQWRNAGTLKECGKCSVHKGASFGQKAGTTLQRPPSAPSASEQKLAKQLAEAQAELAKLSANATDSQEADEAGTSELANAVTVARDELKQLQDCSEFYRSLIPDFEQKLADAQGKVDAAAAARRAANPLKKQLEGAEQYQARMAKKLVDAKAGLEERRKGLVEAQAALEKQQAAVSEAELVVAKADAEVAALAARFALERNAAPAQATSVPADASTVVQVQAHEGYVTVAFAEEKWAEREAAFAAQIAQLQAMVVQAEDAQSEAAPSETGDVVPDFLDDGAWSKVERGKRHKLLLKERDTLARNVRTKLSKVALCKSPFFTKC